MFASGWFIFGRRLLGLILRLRNGCSQKSRESNQYQRFYPIIRHPLFLILALSVCRAREPHS
ncbi:predicted protein [Brucella abortus bv. 5 str. B3196]|nr:predicted protein [Brucella abortus bv. 5 str. B3196]